MSQVQSGIARGAVAGCWLAASLALCASSAWAGGFTFPENGTRAVGRGGAYGLGGVGPEVLAFNPAMLSRLRGHQLTLDLNLIDMNTSFVRAPEGEGEDRVVYPEVNNDAEELPAGFFPAPMLFFSSDLGLEDFTLAAGVYGPSAYGHNIYPEGGPQRFVLIESRLLQVYYSLAAAYHWEGLRVGGVFQLSTLSINLRTTASNGATVTAVDSENPTNDAYTRIKVTDLQPTGIVGVAYDISPSWTVGLSYKLPISWEGTGEAEVEFANEAFGMVTSLDDGEATFKTTEADVLRGGVRYAHLECGEEIFDLELTATWEFWSRQESFQITLPDLVLDFGGDPIRTPVEPITVPKRWEDTLSLRLGGDWNLTPWLGVRAGGFYESATVPEATTHMDFFAYSRFGGGLGATILLGGGAELDLGYLYFATEEREVDEGELKIIAPLAGGEGAKAVNNGRYSADLHLLSVGLTWRFGGPERDLRAPRAGSF
jgi:long-chain fatty acid transport protein